MIPVDPLSFVPVTRGDDPRLGESARFLVDRHACRPGDVVLIGVPDERGIVVNHGRPGAKAGPHAFRTAFYRLPGSWPLWDAGDVELTASNRTMHDQLATLVATVVRQGALPIVIGGGHDATFGGMKGVVQAVGTAGIMNIDAHLDLRPAEPHGDVGSGSAYRRLIEDGVLRGEQLVEWGYQPHAVSQTHLQWAKLHGVRLWSYPEICADDPARCFASLLTDLAARHGHAAVSLDLDAIVSPAAPGVSAPAPFGFAAEAILACLQLAAQQPQWCYLDVMELSPPHDEQGRTARLAAVLVWHVLRVRAEGVVI
ncbi:MAG: formimidoylglutamase [Deltaproteobacteria bacterium]|nr:formimidoylglutamase [Deltaproteobacteria bacterium]